MAAESEWYCTNGRLRDGSLCPACRPVTAVTPAVQEDTFTVAQGTFNIKRKWLPEAGKYEDRDVAFFRERFEGKHK